MDCSLPGSSVHGVSQARILEWAAISFSRGSSQSRDWTQVSCIEGRRFTLWATREVPQIEEAPFYSKFVECFLSWKGIGYVKQYWSKVLHHLLRWSRSFYSLFYQYGILTSIDFSDIKATLHSWHKFHLIMIYFIFLFISLWLHYTFDTRW